MSIRLPILSGASPGPAPAPMERMVADGAPRLVDSYGRVIADLRLSLTDRCNFRCTYCMEPDVRFKRKVDLLTDSEFVRLVRLCAGFGIRRVRLTGGEPTLHPTLTELIADISAVGLEDLSMTTNGSRAMPADLEAWRRAGLRRVTFSLDTLREDRFAAITRSTTSVATVTRAIADAVAAGLTPVKVNAVIVRGFNDDEIEDLASLARELDVEMRFIEYMPLDSGHHWEMGKVVTADEILRRLEGRFALVARGRPRPEAPATDFAFADGGRGGLGVIASVTRPFCGACSRLRITADGKVVPCLFSHEEWDIRGLLRGGADDGRVMEGIAAAVWAKNAGHRIRHEDFRQPARPMSAIGG